jgi:hypothetical protein
MLTMMMTDELRTQSDGKISHDIWQGELKKGFALI